jgi:hypothetical protein
VVLTGFRLAWDPPTTVQHRSLGVLDMAREPCSIGSGIYCRVGCLVVVQCRQRPELVLHLKRWFWEGNLRRLVCVGHLEWLAGDDDMRGTYVVGYIECSPLTVGDLAEVIHRAACASDVFGL